MEKKKRCKLICAPLKTIIINPLSSVTLSVQNLNPNFSLCHRFSKTLKLISHSFIHSIMPPNKSRKNKPTRDPFFDEDSTKRRKVADDDEIDSDSDEDGFLDSKDEPEYESEEETAAETKKRIAHEYLQKYRESVKKEKEQRDEEEDDDEDDDSEDDEGVRDSLVAQRLIKEQQEESGRIRKAIASRF